MYDDGIDEIEFPTPICSDATPHAKHRIAGTWREECPGVEGPAMQHYGTDERPCAECGHWGNGQVPGCTCIGCDWPRTAWDGRGNVIVPGARQLAAECGAELRTFPFGYCNRPAGHPTDSLNHDRVSERPARNRATDADRR